LQFARFSSVALRLPKHAPNHRTRASPTGTYAVFVFVEPGLSTIAVGNGLDVWNNGCGNSDAHRYPIFTESSSCSTSPCLDVKLQTGLGPLDDDGNYAPSSFNPATGTITIYTLYGPPPGNQTTPLDDASVRFYTAHEVGHALGLKEDSCSGGVMNGANFGGASTAVYEECQTADFMNTT